MLTLRPEQSPKNVRIACWLFNSAGEGFAKRAAASAYSEQRSFAKDGRTGCRIPCRAAYSMILCRAMMNNRGDNGSPCLSPRACLMLRLGLPFIRILEEEDARIAAIQLRHLLLKSSAARTSRRYCHPIESKALEMSSLMKSVGCFFLCIGAVSPFGHTRSYHGYTFA